MRELGCPFLLVVMLLVIISLPLSAQLRSKIRRPRQNQPAQTTPPATDESTRTAKPASTSAPSGDEVIDDDFTWFQAVATEALGQNNIPYSTGWVLKSHVRIFGDFPNRSAIKLVVTKAGRPIATTRCEVDIYRKGPNDIDQSYMWTNECWRKDTATKETGNLEVQVFTVNGDTDETKLVRTYKIDLRTVNHVLAGQHEGVAPPDYYIPRHAEAPGRSIFLRPTG